jgi:hypothetical protein
MIMDAPQIMSIQLPAIKDKSAIKEIVSKEKSVRKVMEEWKLDPKYLEREIQMECVINMNEQNVPVEPQVCQEFRRQVCAKISGYKSQDMKKNLYDESKFVKFEDVLRLMANKKMMCFYCQKQALLFYEHVRDNYQWTLDRIDNKMGHNTDNVEIACLNCNLRRRTMYHERYVFTKQMCVVKMIE